MKYPSNPKTNLKAEYEALKKQRDEEIEWERRMAEKREKGREEYRAQLKQLSAIRGGWESDADSIDSGEKNRGWFGWVRGWKRKSNADKDTPENV